MSEVDGDLRRAFADNVTLTGDISEVDLMTVSISRTSED